MAEFLAYRISTGKLTIDKVPEKLKSAVQNILDKQGAKAQEVEEG
jgi:hypothetical protein